MSVALSTAIIEMDSPFPTLFDAQQMERCVQYDPTVDTPRVEAPVVDLDERHPLERGFPRVMEGLVLLWGSPLCGEYLQSLIVMDPGEHRQGFPPELIEDLMLLEYCHNYRPELYSPAVDRGAARG